MHGLFGCQFPGSGLLAGRFLLPVFLPLHASAQGIPEDFCNHFGKAYTGSLDDGTNGGIVFIFTQTALGIYFQHIELTGLAILADIDPGIAFSPQER